MRKALFLFMVFGLVGLMCGSTSGQDAEVKKNVTKLKETGNCQKCNLYFANLKDADLHGANLSEADLSKANLEGANMENIRNLDSAIKCKTIMPDGKEENSGCK